MRVIPPLLVPVLKSVPVHAVETVLILLDAMVRMVRAGADHEAQEEALMTSAEEIKRKLDQLKFAKKT